MGEPKIKPKLTQDEMDLVVQVFKLLREWKRDQKQKRVVKAVR